MARCVTFIRSAPFLPSRALQHRLTVDHGQDRFTHEQKWSIPLEQGCLKRLYLCGFVFTLLDWLIKTYRCWDSKEMTEEMLPGLVRTQEFALWMTDAHLWRRHRTVVIINAGPFSDCYLTSVTWMCEHCSKMSAVTNTKPWNPNSSLIQDKLDVIWHEAKQNISNLNREAEN